MNKNSITNNKIPADTIKHCMSLLGCDTAEELNERMEGNYKRHLSLYAEASKIIEEIGLSK